jgi:hypothetical protein
MPTLVNRNAHGVRSGGYRLGAGEVRDVSGEQADALSSINGVETASDEESREYKGRGSGGKEAGTPGRLRSMQEHYAQVRLAGKTLTVVIPLQEVIGDDAAPYGPPSGTITTKQALAEDPEQRKHFADHERIAGEEENENLSEVERGQASARAQLEELQSEVEQNKEETQQDREAGAPEPKPTRQPKTKE